MTERTKLSANEAKRPQNISRGKIWRLYIVKGKMGIGRNVKLKESEGKRKKVSKKAFENR